MGRPPLGDKAMTDAERQRKRRAKLVNEAAVEWKPEYILPATTRADEHHNEFLDRLHGWLGYSDLNDVTKFFADMVNSLNTIERYETLKTMVAERLAAEERTVIAAEERLQAWIAANPGKDPQEDYNDWL